MLVLVLLLGALLGGCYNISTQVMPENPDVKAAIAGEDCSSIIFGVGFGKSTIAAAQRSNFHVPGDSSSYRSDVSTPITKIRTINIRESYIVIGGERCVEVIGEP